MKKRKNIVSLFSIIILLVCLGACSAAKHGMAVPAEMQAAADMAVASNYDTAEAPMAAPAGEMELSMSSITASQEAGGISGGGDEGGDLLYGTPDAARKLIREGFLELETLQYDESLQMLSLLIQDTGSYVESSSGSGNSVRNTERYAHFVVRVPAEQFSVFMRRGGEIGNILQESSSSQDITDAFYDTEARLASLRVMEERLLALLSKSTELKDILSLEQSLSETRYEIERLTGTLRKWEALVAYSKIEISLREVQEYIEPAMPAPRTLSQRISARFSDNAQALGHFFASLLVWIIGGLPILLPLAMLFGIVLFIVLSAAKRSARKSRIVDEKSDPEN